jgi:hypothetical protein
MQCRPIACFNEAEARTPQRLGWWEGLCGHCSQHQASMRPRRERLGSPGGPWRRCGWPATYTRTGTAIAFIISELPGERAEAHFIAMAALVPMAGEQFTNRPGLRLRVVQNFHAVDFCTHLGLEHCRTIPSSGHRVLTADAFAQGAFLGCSGRFVRAL